MTTKDINQILFDSCSKGDSEGVELALKGGADINYEGEEFPYTPLDAAIYNSNYNLVNLLISNDALVSEMSILLALEHRNVELIKELLNGNLSDITWSVIFKSISNEMERGEDEALIEIFRLIERHLSVAMLFFHKAIKENQGDNNTLL